MLNPTQYRLAIQTCREQDGEAIFECISSYFGNTNSPRTLREVSIRTFAIQVIAFVSVGHLMTMQGVTLIRSATAIVMLLAFFTIPEILIVQLLYRIGKVICRAISGQRASCRYRIAACVGSHVVTADMSVPMERIDPSTLRFQKSKYNIIWIGRLLALLLVLVQSTGSCMIGYRSLTQFNYLTNHYVIFDFYNSKVALGCVAAVLHSILITLLNGEWSHTLIEGGNYQLSDTEILQSVNPEGNNAFTSRGEFLAAATNSTSAAMITSSRAWYSTKFLQYLSKKNIIFEKRIAVILPVDVQLEIEITLAVQAVWILVMLNLSQSHPPYHLDWELMRLYSQNPGSVFASKDYPPEPPENWKDYLVAWPYMILRSLGRLQAPLAVLLGLLYLRILISYFVRLTIYSKRMRSCMPNLTKFLANLHKWVTSGRSIISFPLVWAGILLLLVLRVHMIVHIIKCVRKSEQKYSRASGWDRDLVNMMRFKDPWYDSMYIL